MSGHLPIQYLAIIGTFRKLLFVCQAAIRKGYRWSTLSLLVWAPALRYLAPANLILVSWSPMQGTFTPQNGSSSSSSFLWLCKCFSDKQHTKYFFYLKWIQTHELCDTGAVLYQPSYQPSWELVTLWNCNIPVNDQWYYWRGRQSYFGRGYFKEFRNTSIYEQHNQGKDSVPLLKSFNKIFCIESNGLTWKHVS